MVLTEYPIEVRETTVSRVNNEALSRSETHTSQRLHHITACLQTPIIVLAVEYFDPLVTFFEVTSYKQTQLGFPLQRHRVKHSVVSRETIR